MLNELDIPYRHIDFDIHGSDANDNPIYEEIVQMNPHATVPVLKRGDDVVWDSLAINLYLADAFGRLQPAKGLVPAVQWSLWAAGIEDPIRTAKSHHSRFPEDQRNPEVAAKARNALIGPFDKLDTWLRSSPYLAGDTFSVADVNVICVLARISDSGFRVSRWPEMERWMGECGSRPALTRVFE